MDLNLLIFIIGCLIIVISVFMLIKNRGLDDTSSFEEDTYLQGRHNLINIAVQNNLQEEINEIKNQVQKIREEVQNVFALTQLEKSSLAGDLPSHDLEESFSQMLNYKIFAEKNGDIINLLELGESPLVIAKRLNKSVREVEMVQKLIK